MQQKTITFQLTCNVAAGRCACFTPLCIHLNKAIFTILSHFAAKWSGGNIPKFHCAELLHVSTYCDAFLHDLNCILFFNFVSYTRSEKKTICKKVRETHSYFCLLSLYFDGPFKKKVNTWWNKYGDHRTLMLFKNNN